MAMIRSMLFDSKKLTLPTKERAIPGRVERMLVPARHFVNGNKLEGELALPESPASNAAAAAIDGFYDHSDPAQAVCIEGPMNGQTRRIAFPYKKAVCGS